MKLLYFLTAEYPFGKGETFIESELPFLSQYFDKIIILTRGSGEHIRVVPANVEISTYHLNQPKNRLLATINALTSLSPWRELLRLTFSYRKFPTPLILKSLINSWYQGNQISEIVTRAIKRNNNKNAEIYCYSYWCDDTALSLALMQKKHSNLITFSRVHRWDVYFYAHRVSYLPFRTFIAQHLKAIFSISQDAIDYIKHDWMIKEPSIFLSRLGIDAKEAPVQPDENQKFTIISCSNLIPVKRVHLIIQALAEQTSQNIMWLHIGDGPERITLKQNAFKLLSDTKVEYEFLGAIPNPQVFQTYYRYKPHVFINVSSSEGVPVSIMEAFACGIPVIATAVGGTPEIVNERNGILLSANAGVDEISKAIDTIINSNTTQQEMAHAAYQTWSQFYDANKNFRLLLKQIDSLTKSSSNITPTDLE